MSKFATLLGGNGALAAGASAALLVGGAGVYFKDALIGTPDTSAPIASQSAPTDAPQTAPTQSAEAEAPLTAPDTPAQTTATAGADSATPLASSESADQAAVMPAPSFDLARIAPDGSAMLAGKSAPNQTLEILLDGEVLAEVNTGADGSFAFLGELPDSAGARVLTLRQADSGQISEGEILVAPILSATVVEGLEPTPAQKQAEARSEPPADTGTEPMIASTETSTQATPQPVQQGAEEGTAANASTSLAAQSQVVLMATAEGVEVLQPANPGAISSVALDAISYSEAGDVQLSGRAPESGFVRVYLDNKPITTHRIREAGSWRTELPDVDTGIYTLRVDQIDESGSVTSRVETPFKREEPANMLGAALSAVTVQPGATLWAIARERYGEGQLYVQLYEANKDQIRNPDLIYPGQVFDIPG